MIHLHRFQRNDAAGFHAYSQKFSRFLRDGEIVGKEGDFGNAAELRMVLQEIHPESVIEIREFVGHLMSSS